MNEWRDDDWHRLRFTYSTTPPRQQLIRQSLLPHRSQGADATTPVMPRAVRLSNTSHFLGPDKPWHSATCRTSASSPTQTTTSMEDQTSSPYQHIYDYASLEDHWHDVYDRHCRLQSRASNPYFEVPKYLPAWDNQNSMDTSGGEFCSLPRGASSCGT